MWKNYIKIAFRSLFKQKQFGLLNFIGLALGISTAGLLILYVIDEISYDRYHQNRDQIYRVLVHVDWDGEQQKWASAPNAVGPTALENISAVKDQVRFLRHNFGQLAFIQSGKDKLIEPDFYWSDPSITHIFDMKIIQQSSETVLTAPNQVLINQSSASKYFGSQNPLGQIIKLDNSIDLEIVGVFEDFPGNSLLDAQMIGSFETMKWAKELRWGNSSFETYLLLEPGASVKDVERSMAEILDQNVSKSEQWYSFSLQPLTDVHLKSDDISNSYTSNAGDFRQIKILFYLALILIVIACINYMNMATSRSYQRFKDVAINKTIGASRKNLVSRFYLETGILVSLAMVFSLLLLRFSLSFFNQIAGKNLQPDLLLSPLFILGYLVIALLIITISGAYPAFYLSSFTPADLFGLKRPGRSGGGTFRKGLVILQFTASIIIIVSTFVFNSQLKFIQSKNLGYNPEMTIGIHTAGSENITQTNGFLDKMRTIPEVSSVAHVQTFPGKGGSGYVIHNPRDGDKELPVEANRVSPEILDVLSLDLIAGKTLPLREATRDDSLFHVVINEKAASFLGYTPEEAIGKEAPGLFYNATATIAGVVKNFHFESLHRPIGGYVFHNRPSESKQFALAKLETSEISKTLGAIQKTFSETIPNSAFEYTFLDQQVESLYHREKRTATIFMIFSVLSIFIACLGLYGLTAFTIERRTKEIGIRKILGASVSRITGLLSKDFLRLVVLAILISIPVSWYLMNNWLQNFAFRVDISFWIFIVAGMCALIIAILTVSLQGIRAAINNPINSLRSE